MQNLNQKFGEFNSGFTRNRRLVTLPYLRLKAHFNFTKRGSTLAGVI